MYIPPELMPGKQVNRRAPQLHHDKRGFFQELYRFNESQDYKQLSWLSLEPKTERGGHYHRHTRELFIVLEGTVVIDLRKWGDKVITESHRLEQGMALEVWPPWTHTLRSEEGARVLSLTSQHFNPNDPDCYVEE